MVPLARPPSILQSLPHGWTDPHSRHRGRSGGTQCDQDGPRGRVEHGWQFMDEVRVHPGLRQVPIIVVSAYGSADGVRSVGATDYLKKPFDPETLLAVVSRHA